MRIALVIDTFGMGGAESMLMATARLLKLAGHQPILLHFGNKLIEKFAAQNSIEQHVIPFYGLYKNLIFTPFFTLAVLRFIRRLKLTCMHTHLLGPILAFSPLCFILRLPHIGTLHDVYMIEENPKYIWPLKLSVFLNTLLIAVSKETQGFYLTNLRLSESNILYIPNFTMPNFELENRNSIRLKLGIDHTELLIISVGRLVPLKRIEILIDAARLLANVSDKFQFIVAGDGPEQPALQAKINELDLSNSFSLLGFREDIEPLLAASDVFVMVSETEGMPKALLEAMAAGLPLISTDAGGIKELIINKVNGYLLENMTSTQISEELKNNLLYLYDNTSTRVSMGEENRKIVSTKYNAKLFLDSHISAYSNTKPK